MQLEAALDVLVNFECGVITYVSEVPGQPCEPAMQIYVAEYQDPGALHPDAIARVPSSQRQTSGAGLTREEALWSTIGEAIERYSASNWRWREQIFCDGDAAPMGRDFLESVILYDSADYKNKDFPYHRPDPKITRGWMVGKDVLTGEAAAAPSSLCCMHYDAQTQEEILDRAYSTGLACHGSEDQASLAGLYELVERDAFASHWLANVTPGRLATTLVDEKLPASLVADLRRLNLTYSVLALETDVKIPVFACILELPGGGIATGASAGMNVDLTLRKAVVECLHTYNWCLEMKRLNLGIDDVEALDDFKDHVAWYMNPKRSEVFRWGRKFTKEIATIPAAWSGSCPENPPDQLQAAAERLQDAGKRTFVIDLTPPDIAGVGFRVMRAFAPGLQPLSAGFQDVHTGTRRLKEFCAFKGVKAPSAISKLPPHSFP